MKPFELMTRKELLACQNKVNEMTPSFTFVHSFTDWCRALCSKQPPFRFMPRLMGLSYSGKEVWQTGTQQYKVNGETFATLQMALDA